MASVTTSRSPTHHPVDIWSGGRIPDGGALREACSLGSRRSCWRIQSNDQTLHQSIPAQTATTLVELDQARFALRFVAERPLPGSPTACHQTISSPHVHHFMPGSLSLVLEAFAAARVMVQAGATPLMAPNVMLHPSGDKDTGRTNSSFQAMNEGSSRFVTAVGSGIGIGPITVLYLCCRNIIAPSLRHRLGYFDGGPGNTQVRSELNVIEFRRPVSSE